MNMLDELVTKIDQTMSNMDNRVRRKLDEPLMQRAPDASQPPLPPANAGPAARTPGTAQPPPSDNPWAPIQSTMVGYAKPNENPQDWPNKFRHPAVGLAARAERVRAGLRFDYEHELTNDDTSDWPTVPNR